MKLLRVDPELWCPAIFGTKSVSIFPNKIFFFSFVVEDWVLYGKKQLQSHRNCSLGSGAEPWWAFNRQGPKIVWLFNVFKTIKHLTMALKNYIHCCMLSSYHTRFRVSIHSIFAWMWRKSMLETTALPELTATRFAPTIT